MLSVFEASLISERNTSNDGYGQRLDKDIRTDWLAEKRVKVRGETAWDEEDLGDSCCFGTRTVEIGVDCVWKLHGGV